MGKVETIIQLAQQVADERERFFEIKGPGAGDTATGSFMQDLRTRVQTALGTDPSEKRICGESNLAVDFYLEDEATIIEIALSLRNSNSEFERDILKALLAQEEHRVDRLVFVSKPGALKRHGSPSSEAIVSWAKRHHDLTIDIHELFDVVNAIKRMFEQTGCPAQIPLLRGGRSFAAEWTDRGIKVDNLRTQPFLAWTAFRETVSILIQNGGTAKRGDAMKSRLGEPGLPLDSIEGHIASKVYGKRPGDAVFRRITPIACILIWAGICKAAPGKLILLADSKHRPVRD
jgi:hypothetical protein